jgi:hypothetical protein
MSSNRCPAPQLTIFYACSVHVFDNVTKDKVKFLTPNLTISTEVM